MIGEVKSKLGVRAVRLIRVLLVVVLLGCFGLLALYSVTNKSQTSDEGIHLTSGFAYWEMNDYRLQPENGNLPQRLAAVPLLFQDINFFAPTTEMFRQSDVWGMAWLFTSKIDNDHYWMVFTARAMIVLAALVGGLVVFGAARSLWGYGGGILALVLYCFSPDVLAHGRLITSDVIGAIAFLGAVWSLSAMLTRISPMRVVLAGIVFGILAVSKFYAVLMFPVTLLVVLCHLLIAKKTFVSLATARELATWPQRISAITGSLVVVGLIAWVVLWSFYGFRYTAFNDEHSPRVFAKSWEKTRPDSEVIAGVIDVAREYHLLPEAYLFGFSYVLKHAENRHGFMAGERSLNGWRHFFLFTFLVKSPVALFALILLAIAALVRARQQKIPLARGDPSSGVALLWVSLLIMIFVHGGAAALSALNIGHRHILPIYFALFVLLGMLWPVCRHYRARGMIALGILLVGYAVEVVRVHPNYLAFFNQLAGGPEKGYTLLVDSSLDWGQDLYALSDWLMENNSGPGAELVTLSYFGNSSPDAEGIQARFWQSRGIWVREAAFVGQMKPGLYVVSATLLQGIYVDVKRPWNLKNEMTYRAMLEELQPMIEIAENNPEALYDYIDIRGDDAWNSFFRRFVNYRAERMRQFLLDKEPIEIINHTLFVYQISSEELEEMVIQPELGLPDDFPIQEFRNHYDELFDQY